MFWCFGVWCAGGGDATTTCLGHHEIAGGIHGDPGWGQDESRHAFMHWVLCCPASTLDRARAVAPITADGWIEGADNYNSWGSAVDACIGRGARDICPLATYCPDGAGSAPFEGRRAGDMWSPYSGDGENRWVQVGTWGGDESNTCLGHHEIAGGVHGNPGWGTTGDGGTYMNWLLCCGDAAAFGPVWFDPASSPPWQGNTWGSAVDYCNVHEGSMELCPYSTYCPDGGAAAPVGGIKAGDMWSPVGDRSNQWVQVGLCESTPQLAAAAAAAAALTSSPSIIAEPFLLQPVLLLHHHHH